MLARRTVDFSDHAYLGRGLFEIQSVTHVLTGRRWLEKVGENSSIQRLRRRQQRHSSVGWVPRPSLAPGLAQVGQCTPRTARMRYAAIDRLTLTDELP